MKTRSCPTAALVEAAHDRRLGERESASLARHVSVCAECARLEADLAALRRLAARRPAPAPALEHQRRRLHLLREAARLEAPRAGRGRRVRWVAALAVAAAGLGIGGLLRGGPPAGSGSEPAASTTAVATPPRTRATMRASPGSLYRRETAPDLDVVTLDAGTLDIEVRKLGPGERFLVRTEDAEVEVRGTQFRVSAEEHGLVSVEVREGRVEVRRPEGTVLLVAGSRWQAPPRALRPPKATSTAARPGAAPPPSAQASTARSRPALQAPRSAGPEGGAAGADAADAAASEAFRSGVKLMEQGDYGAAADSLGRFAGAHPGDARAEDAAFLAIVSLQRAGRHADAAEAARRYLAAFPGGYRRAEANAIAGQ